LDGHTSTPEAWVPLMRRGFTQTAWSSRLFCSAATASK
jgi:hypothetical protein